MIEAMSFQGDGLINEDIVAYKDNRYWVIDGVTPITTKLFFSDVSDAHYLANRFSEEMLSHPNYWSISNVELMEKAMKEVRASISKKAFIEEERKYQPSFALAMVNISENNAYINILSDCYVLINYGRYIRILTDKRIARFNRMIKGVKSYITTNSIGCNEAENLLKEQILKNREMMNLKNGYWVGTIDGQAFKNTISYCASTDKIISIIICTDGFYRLFSNKIIDVHEFFIKRIGIKKGLEDLREFEKKHMISNEIKTSDDASAIKIELI